MNIDGITIHKLLKLPIQKSERMHQLYYNLACDDLKMLRRLFRNVRLLIIDEISMLSNMYLLFAYKRLNEILIDLNENPEASFGNVNVLLLGDLLQLPPVNAPHVFTTINASDVTKAFGSIGAAYNLWQMFDFVELTENMRQREDSAYASLLERVRIGSPTAEDISLLKSRIIDSEGTEESDWDGQLRRAVQHYLSLMDANPSLLCLMPLNADVTQFNLYVMDSLKLKVVESIAKDVMEETYKSSRMKQKPGSKDGNKRERKGKRKLKVSETGGLEEKLHLAIGAKVMLRRNMDPKRKLVNGSIGVLREIQLNPHTKEPDVIRVQFPGSDQPVSISKLTTKFMIGNGLFMNRVQFPVTLAYAITIHKCQGLSLDVAMVDVGPSTFTDSMCYVALSRVKKLSNLHLIRFAPSVVKCDKRCVMEYNRLRTVANENLRAKRLPQLPLIVNYNANPEFKKYRKKIIVSAEEQKKQLSEEMAENIKIRGRPVKRTSSIAPTAPPEKKKRFYSDRSDPVPVRIDQISVLKLRNDDAHACFANAVIQCLLRCELANTKMIECSDELTDTAKAYLALVEAKICCSQQMHSVDQLRNSFGAMSQYSRHIGRDCDPFDFVQDLFPKLPQDMVRLFAYDYDDVGQCRRCGSVSIGGGTQTRSVLLGDIGDETPFRFNRIFTMKHSLHYRCEVPECNTFDDNFHFQKTYTFLPEHRYLILYCPIVRLDNRNNVKVISETLVGLNERNVSFLRARWSVIACVEVCRGRATATHYKAYVHYRDAQWIEANDTYRTILKKKPVFRNMLLYILEREAST